MTTLKRRVRRAAVCLCALSILSGMTACSSDKASTATTSATGASTTTLLGAAGGTSTVPLTTSTLLTPTTLTDANANSIADCVAYIPIGAVLADKQATDLWAIVGRDLTKLNALCTQLLAKSPSTIASLSLKLTAYAQSQTTLPGGPAATTIAAAAATTVPPATTSLPTMPNLICTNLADAEGLVQSLISKPPSTFDTSGSRRTQDVPAQWIVVSQVPDVGSTLTGPPQLGVVKVGEPSVCSASNTGG